MEKVLVEVYGTYGKGDGEQLLENYVENDTKELRGEIVDEYFGLDLIFGDTDGFINGKDNSIGFLNDGGDWDDPTGIDVVITTYAEKKDEIEERYRSSIKRLNIQFGMEEK